MDIQAVIWDFGGVLVRTADHTERERLAQKLGISRQELETRIFDGDNRRRAQFGEVDGDAYLQEVAAEFGVPVEGLTAAFFGADTLDETLMAYIRGLRPRYKTGLLSNAMNNLRALLVTRYPVYDAFDEVIISAEVGLMKPDIAIYSLAVARLSVQSQRAVFVDDFLPNVEGARQAGLQGIHFQSREQTLAELAALGVA
ncbi:MAG: HAD family phosphatase [Anaerolineales bacterium]|nr:HAD family phosphatase [Anaerolineales bacterium]MCW5854453.1 HAD family phosphatase [Anaerolineales bacterium]